MAEPFDVEAPVETILAQTEALCRSRPGFMSRAEWRRAQVERLGAARPATARPAIFST